MNFTNVSVFDAATMMEVGGEDEAGNTAGTGKDVAELTSQVEKSIAAVSYTHLWAHFLAFGLFFWNYALLDQVYEKGFRNAQKSELVLLFVLPFVRCV